MEMTLAEANMIPMWKRICIRLQEMANASPRDWADYNEAYKTLVLLHYEEIYG
jgi:hypothetical protein